MEKYTLEEFDTDHLSSGSLDANGTLMVFDTFQLAADMATWMLEGGPEDGKLPIIGILAHDHNPGSVGFNKCIECEPNVIHTSSADHAFRFADSDTESWSAGWTQYDGGGVTSTYEGDYENDPSIWQDKSNFVVNLLCDEPFDVHMPVGSEPIQPDPDEPVWILYGSPEGICCLVRTHDEGDIERRIIRTFGLDVTIDDIGPSVDQEWGRSE